MLKISLNTLTPKLKVKELLMIIPKTWDYLELLTFNLIWASNSISVKEVEEKEIEGGENSEAWNREKKKNKV